MQKKSNTIYYLIGAVILGAAGFLWYRNMKKKNEPLEPPKPLPPGPSPSPAPKPGPVGPTPASSAKIAELQNLMIKRFVQLNRSSEYDAAAAKGGWGDKSTAALSKLQPSNFASLGVPNSGNIDKWIAAIKKDVETAAKEEQTNQAKQTETNRLIDLAKKYKAHFDKGGTIQLLSDANSVLHKYDEVKNSYISTGKSEKYSKGREFKKGFYWTAAINRGNGQLLLVYRGTSYYPFSPANLIAL